MSIGPKNFDYVKTYNSFKEAIEALRAISYSINSSIAQGLKTECEVVAYLAQNVITDTTNHVGKGYCTIQISREGCEYQTTGCLVFGWLWSDLEKTDLQAYIGHPDGQYTIGSTLETACLSAGWEMKREEDDEYY